MATIQKLDWIGLDWMSVSVVKLRLSKVAEVGLFKIEIADRDKATVLPGSESVVFRKALSLSHCIESEGALVAGMHFFITNTLR